MPVEIRELTIKTHITGKKLPEADALSGKNLALLKQKIMQECLRSLKEKTQRNSFDR